MANIESQLTTIKSAAGGEDVREAIIGALRNINNDVPADMSNPVQITEDMPLNSDLIKPLNPPKLVSQIYIKQAGSGGKTTRLVEATITENGEYPTSDKDDGGGSYDPDKENRYYSKVTVKVPQLANAVLDLEEPITENGTYSAPADWGVDGLRTFTVNVNAATGDGPFQVEFYDKIASDPTASVIQTQIVGKNGNAEFKPPYPTSAAGSFSGWSPNPVNVSRDLKCYPIFGQIIIDPTDIHDDWPVICQRRGAGYPLGSHKLLAYGATFTADEVKTWCPGYTGGDVALNISMNMYKVGEGEGVSHSSWIGSGVWLGSIPGIMPGGNNNSWYMQFQNGIGLRQFLNTAFFNHMDSMFKNNIVQVAKTSLYRDMPMPTTDLIWVPNTSEIGTWQTKLDPSQTYYDFANGITWENSDYVRICNLLDASSVKYVRDNLNNDRNFPTLFDTNIQGTATLDFMGLRDHNSYNGRDMKTYRVNQNGVIIDYGVIGEPSSFNIGFCL